MFFLFVIVPVMVLLYEKRCQCTFELLRLPRRDNRPAQPQPEQHRHGGDGACFPEMVKVEWEGAGGRGAWKAHCPRGGSFTHYLPPGYDTKGLANLGPPRRPQPFVPDFLAMEEAAGQDRRLRKRAQILDALGFDEADLDALLTTVRAMVKPPAKKKAS